MVLQRLKSRGLAAAPISACALSLILTLTDGRHDYGFAGLVMALFGAAILLVAGLAVVLIPAALSPDLLVLALLVGLAGVLVSPALSAAYVLVGSLASPQARNRAGNWVTSGEK
jgi:MFS family permease